MFIYLDKRDIHPAQLLSKVQFIRTTLLLPSLQKFADCVIAILLAQYPCYSR